MIESPKSYSLWLGYYQIHTTIPKLILLPLLYTGWTHSVGPVMCCVYIPAPWWDRRRCTPFCSAPAAVPGSTNATKWCSKSFRFGQMAKASHKGMPQCLSVSRCNL